MLIDFYVGFVRSLSEIVRPDVVLSEADAIERLQR